ncbi:MAG TPA: hypothetical protein DCE55_29275 [Planctomycetaceae bacterium]|nr:hypothetical protein [Planctomycetaceae bacterium]
MKVNVPTVGIAKLIFQQLIDREWHSTEEIAESLNGALAPEQCISAYDAHWHRSRESEEKSHPLDEQVLLGRQVYVYRYLALPNSKAAWKKALIKKRGKGLNTSFRLSRWFCVSCGMVSDTAAMQCSGCADALRRKERSPDAQSLQEG